jgi:serine/threonine protein kinase
MELSAGTRIGPYEIARKIGAGGMGVVYRAKDTRLDRSVAIKVLPEALHADGDRLRRFEQEARTIGALNHPNLVTLHDVGREAGAPYLVYELLEGQSLRALLQAGPLEVREATRIAAEIARGLAAAHGAGVIHRDVKPDNVFVTGDGRVKILDFGIAKLRRDEPADVANAPTLGGTAATGTGVVIGTPGYMAPEQLASSEVDARTDVFALGVVLFEMLVGKRPFAADTGIEESYAIVKTAPPALPASVPPHLGRIVERCLEKRREARFQSAADLAFALETDDDAPATVPAKRAPRRKIPILPITGAAIVLAALATTVWLVRARANVHWPELVEGGPIYTRVTYHSEPKWFARFWPDGKSVVYSRRDKSDEYSLMRATLGRPSAAQVPEVNGRLLDVSSTGELALRRRQPDAPGGVLVTMSEGAGAAKELAQNVHDAAYVRDQLAIVRDPGAGMAIELPIGTTIVPSDGRALDSLRASHDATMLAVVARPIVADTRGTVVIYDLAGHELARSQAHTEIGGLAWSPDDREVWVSTELGLQALDLSGHERVLLRTATDLFVRDVLPDGRVLAVMRDARMRAFVRHGDPANDVGWRDSAVVKALSRDGSTIALLSGDGANQTAEGYELFIRRSNPATPISIDHGMQIALTSNGELAVVLRNGKREPIGVVPTVARAGTPRALATGPIDRIVLGVAPEISADDKRVVVLGAARDKPPRLWAIPLEGGEPTPIGPDRVDIPTDDNKAHFQFAVSPDGSRIALPAQKGVMLVNADGSGEVALTSDHGETPLGFSTDSKALFVWRTKGWPRPIVRVELDGGARSELMPFAPEGPPDVADVAVDGTGQTIAYSWIENDSDLFVLSPP